MRRSIHKKKKRFQGKNWRMEVGKQRMRSKKRKTKMVQKRKNKVAFSMGGGGVKINQKHEFDYFLLKNII